MGKGIKKNQQFGKWKLLKFIAEGGNGEVWKCKDENDKTFAIKFLKGVRKKAYQRFLDETKVIEDHSDILGIIPILDKFLPTNLIGNIPYYVMPLAENVENTLRNKSFEIKIDAIVQIAQTLVLLHERGISHRDIKPGNLLSIGGNFLIADFGLVDFPNKIDISGRNEAIGPKWTLAPEMRRNPKTADGRKADMYSLSKTLWILLTGRYKGFDGQYSVDSIIELKQFYPSYYLTPIDNLMVNCTDNDPDKRYTAQQFVDELIEWKKVNLNFDNLNLRQWIDIRNKLFPILVPERVSWFKLEEIIGVLNIISSYDQLNHVFFPNGGGLDLTEAKFSFEEKCIELNLNGMIQIIKPKSLSFESFEDPSWNYFRIDCSNLDPTLFEDNHYGKTKEVLKFPYELVAELAPGEYFENEAIYDQEHYISEEYITPFSRSISRWHGGSFVIFCKSSWYNRLRGPHDAYDGRHNGMEPDEFRNHINKYVETYNNYGENNRPNEIINKRKKSEYENKLILKKNVYRCGYCGSILSSKGQKLDEIEWNKSHQVLLKYGNEVVENVSGYCCEGN